MVDNKDKDSNLESTSQELLDNDLARKLSTEEKKYISSLLEKDPLADCYKKNLFIYLFIAIALLLWPFDFISSSPENGAGWIKTSNGIEFVKAGKVASVLPARPLYNKMLSGSGLTLEAWVAPATTDQSGPARIISYSLDPSNRNFTLGQDKENLVFRLRTPRTGRNGLYPHMVVDNVFNSTLPLYITVTYEFSTRPTQRIYINGKIRAEKSIPGGDFSTWAPSHYLVFGNEVTGGRPWLGKLFFVSIYNRALKPHEVRQNFIAAEAPDSRDEGDLISSGLVARYFFDENAGNMIKDSSGNAPPLDLQLPEKLTSYKKYFLAFSFIRFTDIHNTSLNILIFIPFGFLLSGAIHKKNRPLLHTCLIVIVAGTLFTLSVESIQYFLISRISTLIDVINNILGTILGVLFFRSWKKLLQSRHNLLQDHSHC